MVNYNNGKIYKIVCHTTNKIYIGSTTTKRLSQRLSEHKTTYKRFVSGKSKACTSSRFVLENNNYSMELLEILPCECKDELTLREAHYIRTIECVNNGIPHRTHKEYRQDNKETISEKKREYYQKNKEKLIQYNSDYRQLNKEKINQYYQKNKEKLSKKIECECGAVINKSSITGHIKSKRHQKYIQES
jgi:Zn ribbon nucleic-acid-binding protein